MTNDSTHPLKVFLCHASGDKPPVRDLYERLVADGVDAWLDQEKLLPGQDWRREIPRAVREADVVVVCLSRNSITKEGYVQKEIKFALDIAEEKPEGTIFLIPARLEDCTVPERLSRWQWVDLYEENGFVKLLRSLKLRADAVGATIEPTAYEASEKEIERRVKQLYTEGLAAFYTEDWDRACQRFQTILSEHPNHKNAAEKLAEAERQRNLAKLYAQAADAIRSRNWQTAIKTLDVLSQKSVDYKDVAQLLKNARKQEQLEELYAEAKTLQAGEQWEAVVKVFEQISAIDSAYPDPDGLLPSAQKEVAELERLSHLNELYCDAVSQIDAGQWYEARRLLEQVHKAQTGFLETERLLRKVEDEIAQVEEHSRRNEQVNVLYEQAHGLLRSKKWRKALDKIDEIEGLESHFEDKDDIAQKAKAELEREDQEAQMQNQLAAMYAEAVRLLKEEKYQEALDKWEEVKAADAKYPDRQWVQRTARNKLTEMAKPTQIRPRFVKTKSLWMGIVGFVVIAFVIRGIILSGKGSQNVLPISTPAPTESAVLNPTATEIADKTNTPRPATPVPTTSGYADPIMYDDFSGNELNPSLWYATEFGNGSSPSRIYTTDGLLNIVVNNYRHHVMLNSGKSYKPKDGAFFIEAKMMLDADTTKSGTDSGISINTRDGHSKCSIFAGQDNQTISCWSYYFDVQQKSYDVGIVSGTWHVLRIEVNPETMTFTYVIDGKQIGAYVPRNSERLLNLEYGLYLDLHNWGESAQSPASFVDYVRIGLMK